MTHAKGPQRTGDGEGDEVLVDLSDTSVAPEQGANVKGGGRVEYPNVASGQLTSRESLKSDSEVTDYQEGGVSAWRSRVG